MLGFSLSCFDFVLWFICLFAFVSFSCCLVLLWISLVLFSKTAFARAVLQ